MFPVHIRPIAAPLLHSSICILHYRLASIMDIIQIDCAQFRYSSFSKWNLNERKFVWTWSIRENNIISLDFGKKGKYFFYTFYIVYYIYVTYLFYLQGILSGCCQGELTISVEHHDDQREVTAQEVTSTVNDIEDRFKRRCFWNAEPNICASPPLCIIINIVNNCK